MARVEERYSDSLKLLTRMLRGRPDYQPAVINMENALRDSLAACGRFLENRDWEQAFLISLAALNFDNTNIRFLHVFARACFYIGLPKKAFMTVERALEMGSSQLSNRETVVSMIEEFSGNLTVSIEKNPKNAGSLDDVLSELGKLCDRLILYFIPWGHWTLLKRICDVKIGFNPDDVVAHHGRAIVYDIGSQYDDLLRDVSFIPKGHSHYADGLLFAAGREFALENFVQAEALYAAALQEDPSSAKAAQGIRNCARHRAWREEMPDGEKLRLSGRVRIFIVTYNDPDSLSRNVAALYDHLEDPEVHVINNHKDPVDRFVPEGVRVYNNVLRHPNSTGHLARSWNQALMFGFGRAKAPECDWVIGMQDDLVVRKSLWRFFEREKENFDFTMIGPGDQFWAINIAGLKKIDFWDECLTSIILQEADYYHRAYLALGERACLEDHAHQENGPMLIRTTDFDLRRLLHGVVSPENAARILRSPQGSTYARQAAYFEKKWNTMMSCHNFLVSKERTEPAPETFCFYPWFFD